VLLSRSAGVCAQPRGGAGRGVAAGGGRARRRCCGRAPARAARYGAPPTAQPRAPVTSSVRGSGRPGGTCVHALPGASWRKWHVARNPCPRTQSTLPHFGVRTFWDLRYTRPHPYPNHRRRPGGWRRPRSCWASARSAWPSWRPTWPTSRSSRVRSWSSCSASWRPRRRARRPRRRPPPAASSEQAAAGALSGGLHRACRSCRSHSAVCCCWS